MGRGREFRDSGRRGFDDDFGQRRSDYFEAARGTPAPSAAALRWRRARSAGPPFDRPSVKWWSTPRRAIGFVEGCGRHRATRSCTSARSRPAGHNRPAARHAPRGADGPGSRKGPQVTEGHLRRHVDGRGPRPAHRRVSAPARAGPALPVARRVRGFGAGGGGGGAPRHTGPDDGAHGHRQVVNLQSPRRASASLRGRRTGGNGRVHPPLGADCAPTLCRNLIEGQTVPHGRGRRHEGPRGRHGSISATATERSRLSRFRFEIQTAGSFGGPPFSFARLFSVAEGHLQRRRSPGGSSY